MDVGRSFQWCAINREWMNLTRDGWRAKDLHDEATRGDALKNGRYAPASGFGGRLSLGLPFSPSLTKPSISTLPAPCVLSGLHFDKFSNKRRQLHSQSPFPPQNQQITTRRTLPAEQIPTKMKLQGRSGRERSKEAFRNGIPHAFFPGIASTARLPGRARNYAPPGVRSPARVSSSGDVIVEDDEQEGSKRTRTAT